MNFHRFRIRREGYFLIIGPCNIMLEAETSNSTPILASDRAAMVVEEEAVEFVDCECCKLREECTSGYVARVRAAFDGRWVCGLCAEAIKEEICRYSPRTLSTDEALDLHATFRRSRQPLHGGAAATGAKEHLIAAVRQLLRRSRDYRSMSSSRKPPLQSIARSESCFPALAG
ncbi:uncharacterized protein LOC144711124 [Wolffia australiana]